MSTRESTKNTVKILSEVGEEKNIQPLLCTGTGKSIIMSKICNIHNLASLIVDCKSVTCVDVPLQSGTVDGFIFVGTNFRGLNENDTFVGFRIRGHSIFLHNSYRKSLICGYWNFVDRDPPQKPRKLVPHEN